MNLRTIKQYILSLPGTKLSYPYGRELATYSVNSEMFALIEVGKKPLRLSVRCDRRLSRILIDRYEEVMPGHKLNKDKWITIVTSGQLKDDEVLDLVRHSYLLVSQETA